MPDQADICRKCFSERIGDRQKAAELLDEYFSILPDKAQAWRYLISLAQDRDNYVQSRASGALRKSFCLVPDKTHAWFDLVRLAQDEDHNVRWAVIGALGTVFDLVSDKDQAWLDLITLAQDKNPNVRWGAVSALGIAFGSVPNKNQAWMTLHRLAHDKDHNVRWGAVGALGTAFGLVPEKDKAWADLARLAHDEDHNVRRRAAYVLGTAIGFVPDNTQAWRVLHKLTLDKSSDVRWGAAYALGKAFRLIPDKNHAWLDLVRLVKDEENDVRRAATNTLGTAFVLVPDKDQAWHNLVDLTQDWDRDVRQKAANILGSAFSLVPHKDQAWLDLVKLTQDESSCVRQGAAGALGTAFGFIPDMDKAWINLERLSRDDDSSVRMFAYHSLGRASVFKATKMDDRDAMKIELKKAIKFFEISSKESPNGPAKFCCPFYRSYFAIAFQGAKEEEVQKYLVEAKNAVGRSESKDELLKVVENLARALRESQRLAEKSFEEVTSELNTYRQYCEKAAEHMAAAEDKAPVTVMLMAKCNPLLEDMIQASIAEIQAKAKLICKITRRSGTEFEAPGAEINKAAKALSSEDIQKTEDSISRIAFQLEEFCRLLPYGKRDLVCKVVKEIDLAAEFSDKVGKIELAMTYVSSAIVTALQPDIRLGCNQVFNKSKNVEGMLDSNRIKILFLAANPEDTNILALDEEIREITIKLRAAEYQDSIELISAWAVRPDDLLQLLNQHKPQIVHFSGHGSDSGKIILNDYSGISKPVSSRAIRALFATLKDNIRAVVLNACYSVKQGEAITQVIDCAVGMDDSIGDRAAIIFAASFYRAIGFGRSIQEAFDQGIAALLLEGIPEEDTPKLLVKNGVNPSQITFI